MEIHLKKLVPILGVVCLAMSRLSAAAYDNSQDDNPKKMAVAVPPGQLISGEDAANVSVSADYTLWTARQDGLAIATSNYYANGSGSSQKGSVHYPKWKLHSGFKVDIGANLHHDGWDIVAEYMTKAKKAIVVE